MFEDPNWPRASKLFVDDPGVAKLHLAGIPTNWSITPGSCDQAPRAIRDALSRFSTHAFSTSNDVASQGIYDNGDFKVSGARDQIIALGNVVSVLLGGDNGLTRIALPGVAAAHGLDLSQIGLLTLDAHLDLRDLSLGEINGNPIRGLIADGLPGANIVQIGLQSFANSPEYARVQQGLKIRCITAETARDNGIICALESALATMPKQVKLVYVDLDLDVIDVAFVPGCPGARPGGLNPIEVRQAARWLGAHPKVVAMDIVELDPALDSGGRTAMAAAAIFLEFAAGCQVGK